MRLGILGTLLVVDDAGVEARVAASRQRVLLAALLVRANRVASVDELAEIVWDGRPPVGAAGTVRAYVMRLRRAVGVDVAPRIVTRDPGYLCQVSDDELDVSRFEVLCSRGGGAVRAGSWQQGSEILAEALGIWRGTVLEDVASQTLRGECVEHLEQERLQAVEWRVEADLHLGRHEQLVPELRDLAQRYPLREHGHAQLMVALARCGRRAEALEAYRRARTALVGELGVEPGPQLRDLHRQILEGDPAVVSGSADTEPVRVSAHGPTVTPRQLPAAVAHFTGRADELRALTGLVEPSVRGRGEDPVVAVAITGMAGVGKTALAMRWAHQVSDRFPDGQLYIDLQGYAPGEPVQPIEGLARFLRALGVAAQQIPLEVDEAGALFRSLLAGKRMLVILDNARSADQARPLLPGIGSSLVIVTSRDRVSGLTARDGAHRVDLDVLPPGEAAILVKRVIGAARSSEDPGSVEELARLCGHVPLALLIAAERVVARPRLRLADLVGQLASEHQRLDALTLDDAGTAVRAALSWSYRTVPAEAARMFRLLGLGFGSDISAEAAAALSGTDSADARRQFALLTGAHLLEESSRDRFRLHDLLRVYAAELASALEPPQERSAAIERLLSWYIHAADAADRVLDPGRPRVPIDPPPADVTPPAFADYDEALGWCDRESANLVAAVRHAASTGHDAIAWQLPAVLFGYFYLRKPWGQWITTHELGLASARRLGDEFADAVLTTGLGIAHLDLQRSDDAIALFHRALPYWRMIGFGQAEGVCLNALGAAHRESGRYAEALTFLRPALPIWREAGDRWGEGITLQNLGETYQGLGRYDLAIEHLEESRTVQREAGDRHGLAGISHDLGQVYYDLGRVEASVEQFREALGLRRELGDRQGEARTMISLGRVYRDTDRPDLARELWCRALSILEEIADPRVGELTADLKEIDAEHGRSER